MVFRASFLDEVTAIGMVSEFKNGRCVSRIRSDVFVFTAK